MIARTFRTWFTRLHHLVVDRRGVTSIVVALSLVAILGMLAVVLDGSYAYSQRRQMQTAADAGALAGARVLWLMRYDNAAARDAAAKAAACDYASRNSAAGCKVELGCGGDNIICVDATRRFDTFFARILSIDTLNASAHASANVREVVATGNLWPIIVPKQDFEKCYSTDPCDSASCKTYTIWDDTKKGTGGGSGTDPNAGAGNAGWVQWNQNRMIPNDPCPGNGVPNLVCELTTAGASGYWQIGDWVGGGNVAGDKPSSQVRSAIQAKMCTRVTVPIWDDIRGTGSNTEYRIAGFAEFVLTKFELTGNDKTIEGHFIRWTEPGETSDQPCTTGFCGIRLGD
jgi:Flp pilus assembly protein TadG